MTKPMAIVTGAPGWLGSRLVEFLAQGMPDIAPLEDQSPGRTVRCLIHPDLDPQSVLPPGSSEIPSVMTINGDLTSPESLPALFHEAKGATVFHCAGVIHPKGRVKTYYEVNTEGTRLLLELAKEAGVKRFIYVSSNSPIGVNPNRDHRFDESSPYNPYMNYGRSKFLAEGHVNEYGTRGDLETVIVRPPWLYGPNHPPRQSLFFGMIRDGKAPVVGDGENMRSMGYIDNVCQGLLLCEAHDIAIGKTYWIADRRAYSMNEILDTVETLLEKEFGVTVTHKRMRLPRLASSIAYTIDLVVQSLGLYHQKIHVLSEMDKTIACSIEKAEKELGYDPKVELEEGMRRSLKWMVEQGFSL